MPIYCKLDQVYSSWEDIRVTQGPTLGPILFNIFFEVIFSCTTKY